MTEKFNNNKNDDIIFDSLDLGTESTASKDQGSRREGRKPVRVRELNSASTAIDRNTVRKEKEIKNPGSGK